MITKCSTATVLERLMQSLCDETNSPKRGPTVAICTNAGSKCVRFQTRRYPLPVYLIIRIKVYKKKLLLWKQVASVPDWSWYYCRLQNACFSLAETRDMYGLSSLMLETSSQKGSRAEVDRIESYASHGKSSRSLPDADRRSGPEAALAAMGGIF